ncbi:PBECR2 nuclease fold domain-containing protein [[Clostridium] leptum]|nr:PBECR2 nuclease fold domain-containing protein [[Clostridium] leptum]
MFKVGEYPEYFNTLLGIDLPCIDIVQSEGLLKHIEKRHPSCVSYIELIPSIIENPDYVGHNPKEPDSVELVKVIDKNMQVAIKLDAKNNYLYIASLYDISDVKIVKRLHSGRLKKCEKS